MAAKKPALCSRELRAGIRSMKRAKSTKKRKIRRAQRQKAKKRRDAAKRKAKRRSKRFGSASRSCTASGFARLDRAIKTASKRKVSAARIARAKAKLASAKKAQTAKNTALCSRELTSGYAAVKSKTRVKKRRITRGNCTTSRFAQLDRAIKSAKQRRELPPKITFATKKLASARKAQAAKNTVLCGRELSSGYGAVKPKPRVKKRRITRGNCTTSRFAQLVRAIKSAKQRRELPPKITFATKKLASARKAQAAKNTVL